MTWPLFYSDPVVAQFGDQKVALRAVGASSAKAQVSDGKLIYHKAYDGVDAVQVPRGGSSEELLVLYDATAPLVFDYEIVDMAGVARVVLHSGAVRFETETDTVKMPDAGFTMLPRMLQIDRPWVLDSTGQRSEAHAAWSLVGADGELPTALRLTVRPGALNFPLLVDPSFSTTGSLSTDREMHTSTLLANGKVLIAGGQDNLGSKRAAELYDPATGIFSTTGNLNYLRRSHTATMLSNGKVLIVGGYDGYDPIVIAELYDPATGTFSYGNGPTARYDHTATLLQNGKVLITGGTGVLGARATAALYDPDLGYFITTGSMAASRGVHSATLLPSGKVLITGGYDAFGGGSLQSAELYDPSSGFFSPAGNMAAARWGHSATLLPNGKVLIAGGDSGTSAELYDPQTGTFSATGNLATTRGRHSSTLLANGKVLIAGGAIVHSTEIYDPQTGTFSAAENLVTARTEHTATLLANGRVLVAGGYSTGYLDSVEIYDPGPGSLAETSFLNSPHQLHTSTLLPDGQVLVAGGLVEGNVLNTAELFASTTSGFMDVAELNEGRYGHTATLLPTGQVLLAGGSVSSAELYDPGGQYFTTTASMAAPRYGHTASLLPNGQVLVAGGSPTAAAELYDPATETFVTTGNLLTLRNEHTATLLPNGKLLVAGGYGGGTLASAELYDQTGGTFSFTGSLNIARSGHSATLLANGKVLIAGGYFGGNLTSAELYDPGTGTFGVTGGLNTARSGHTATLLANGKVLIAGGYAGAYLSSIELYDPASGTFSTAGALASAREAHTATLLPNGKVLITGGYNGEYLTSAELYDPGLGFDDSRRPILVDPPAWFPQPNTLVLGGSGFRGDSEASSGGANNSSTDFPIVHLQRVDNGQKVFIDDIESWGDTEFTSDTIGGLATGHYRMTVVTNSVPSEQSMIACFTCGDVANCAVDETCTNPNDEQCAQCDSGYFRADPQSCVACSAACDVFSWESQSCSSTTNQDRICSDCADIANCEVDETCTTSYDEQCAECDPGYFRLLGPPDSCMPCTGGTTWDCGSGNYRQGSLCGGDSPSDSQMCSSCLPCSAGEYISDPCSGFGFSPNQTCTTCTNGGASYSCPAGEFMSGTLCDGTGAFDTQSCQGCSAIEGCAVYSEPMCTGPADSQCESCEPGYVLMQGTPDQCVLEPVDFFTDGFENGDTSAWSVTVD